MREGRTLNFATTSVGRPTKQRLAKFGLATFDRLKIWDGPMHLTPKGLRVLDSDVRSSS